MCSNCGLSPMFDGFDDCVRCVVSTALVEDPTYLAYATKHYAKDKAWLYDLKTEWKRQESAFQSLDALAFCARSVA
jgi:hypothetical protein